MGVRCYYIALSLVIAGFGREFSSLKSRIQAVMTRKMVYQEVMKELEVELEERDIDVEMHIEYR